MLASIGIHAGIVMTSTTATNITLPSSEGSVMAVNIKKSKIASKNKFGKTTQTKIPKVNKAIAALKKDGTSSSKKLSRPTPSDHAAQQSKSRARVLSVIYEELSQHFVYPKLAQKRNWQGKVLLSLRISANGKINDIQINQSSGYSILDQAAINSLIKMGNLPQIASWLPYEVNLKLPVIYQLTEG